MTVYEEFDFTLGGRELHVFFSMDDPTDYDVTVGEDNAVVHLSLKEYVEVEREIGKMMRNAGCSFEDHYKYMGI